MTLVAEVEQVVECARTDIIAGPDGWTVWCACGERSTVQPYGNLMAAIAEIKIHLGINPHKVTAIPVEKMDAEGPIAYKWSCSCGRGRDGYHKTPEKAIEAGEQHFKNVKA